MGARMQGRDPAAPVSLEFVKTTKRDRRKFPEKRRDFLMQGRWGRRACCSPAAHRSTVRLHLVYSVSCANCLL